MFLGVKTGGRLLWVRFNSS